MLILYLIIKPLDFSAKKINHFQRSFDQKQREWLSKRRRLQSEDRTTPAETRFGKRYRRCCPKALWPCRQSTNSDAILRNSFTHSIKENSIQSIACRWLLFQSSNGYMTPLYAEFTIQNRDNYTVCWCIKSKVHTCIL